MVNHASMSKKTFWPAKSISFSFCAHVISDVWALSQVRKLGRDKSFNLNVFLFIFQRRSLLAKILRSIFNTLQNLRKTWSLSWKVGKIKEKWSSNPPLIIKLSFMNVYDLWSFIMPFQPYSMIPWIHHYTRFSDIWVFPEIGVHKMDGFFHGKSNENDWKWMIWGVHSC